MTASPPVEQVCCDGVVLAIIVRAAFKSPGVTFFTPDEFSQQLAYMRHPAGHEIVPHAHHPVERSVPNTQEVLFIRSGVLRVDFFDDARRFVESRVLTAGDTILLAGGGHGFEVLEDLEMLEVKQGPYSAGSDKVRFVPACGCPPSEEGGGDV